MTTLEAVEALSARARRLALRLYAFAALAVLVGSALGVAGAVLAQWAIFGVASLKVAGIVGVALGTGVVVPLGRAAVRKTIGLRRTAWIEEIARAEGLSAQELGDSFTLDSW